MDNNPYHMKLGSIFKTLREGKKLTLAQLSGEGTDFKICSAKTITRLEQNGRIPNSGILHKLLSVLDVTVEEFEAMAFGGNMKKFNDDFVRIWAVGYDSNYDKMDEMLKTLRKQVYCDESIPTISQAIQLCKGTLLYEASKKLQAASVVLTNALKATAPNVVNNDNNLCLNKIRKQTFSMNEYRIIKTLACIMDDLGERSGAIKLFDTIITSLEREATSYEMRKKLLPTSYFNLSNMLLEDRLYLQALEVAERGLNFCFETKEYKEDGKLHWNKGRAYHGLNDLEQSNLFFQKSHDIFVSRNDTSTAQRLKETALTKYKTTIG